MPLPKTTIEQDLPVRAQQGDENALAALIARMMPAIRSGAAACTAAVSPSGRVSSPAVNCFFTADRLTS